MIWDLNVLMQIIMFVADIKQKNSGGESMISDFWLLTHSDAQTLLLSFLTQGIFSCISESTWIMKWVESAQLQLKSGWGDDVCYS